MKKHDNIINEIMLCIYAATKKLDNENEAGSSHESTEGYLFSDGEFIARPINLELKLSIVLKILRLGFPQEIRLPLSRAELYIDPKAINSWSELRSGDHPELGGNAVIFFDSPSQGRRLCLKISLRSKGLSREINILRRFSRQLECMPNLVARCDLNRWFLCEYHKPLDGISNAEIASRYLRDVATRAYSSFGIKYRTLSQLICHKENQRNELIKLYNRHNLSFPHNLEQKIPCSLVYGGRLIKDTFIDTQDKTIIVDWERVHVNAIAYDLLHTYIHNARDTLNFLEGLSAEEGCLNARDQIVFMAMLHYLIKTSSWHEKNIKHFLSSSV